MSQDNEKRIDGLRSSDAENCNVGNIAHLRTKDHEFAMPLPRAPQASASVEKKTRKKQVANRRTFSSLREPSKASRVNELNDLLYEALCDDDSWHDVVLLYMDNQGRCLIAKEPAVTQVPDGEFLSYFRQLLARIQPEGSKQVKQARTLKDLAWMESLDSGVLVREKCLWVQAPACLRRRSKRLEQEHTFSLGENVLTVVHLDNQVEQYFDADVVQIRELDGKRVQIQYVHGPKVGSMQWVSSNELFRVPEQTLTNEEIRGSLLDGYRALSEQEVCSSTTTKAAECVSQGTPGHSCLQSHSTAPNISPSSISKEEASRFSATLSNWATASEQEIHDFKDFLISFYPNLSPTFRILSHYKVIIDGSGDLKFTVEFDAQNQPKLVPLCQEKWTQCIQLLQKHSNLGREAISEVVKGSIAYERCHAPLNLADVHALSSARSSLYFDAQYLNSELCTKPEMQTDPSSGHVQSKAADVGMAEAVIPTDNAVLPRADETQGSGRKLTFEPREGSWWPASLNHVFFSSWRASARTLRAMAKPVDQVSPPLGCGQQVNGDVENIQAVDIVDGTCSSISEYQHRQTNDLPRSKSISDLISDNRDSLPRFNARRLKKIEEKLAGEEVIVNSHDGKVLRGILRLSKSKGGYLLLQLESNNVCQSFEDWLKRRALQLEFIILLSSSVSLLEALCSLRCEYREGKLYPIKRQGEGDHHARGSSRPAVQSSSRKRLTPEMPVVQGPEASKKTGTFLSTIPARKAESSKIPPKLSMRPTEPGKSERSSSTKKHDHGRPEQGYTQIIMTQAHHAREDDYDEDGLRSATDSPIPGKHLQTVNKKRKRLDHEVGYSKSDSVQAEQDAEVKQKRSKLTCADQSCEMEQLSSAKLDYFSKDQVDYANEDGSRNRSIDANFILERCRMFDDDQKGSKRKDSPSRDVILLSEFLLCGMKKQFHSNSFRRGRDKEVEKIVAAAEHNDIEALSKLLAKFERNITWAAVVAGFDRKQLLSMKIDCMESARTFLLRLLGNIRLAAWYPTHLLKIGWDGLA